MTKKKSVQELAAMFGKMSRTATDDAVKRMVDSIRPHLLEMRDALRIAGRTAYLIDPSAPSAPANTPLTGPGVNPHAAIVEAAIKVAWALLTVDMPKAIDDISLDGARFTWLISLNLDVPADGSLLSKRIRVGLARGESRHIAGNKAVVIACASIDGKGTVVREVEPSNSSLPDDWYSDIVKEMLELYLPE